jgi:protein-disulfide isomerase
MGPLTGINLQYAGYFIAVERRTAHPDGEQSMRRFLAILIMSVIPPFLGAAEGLAQSPPECEDGEACTDAGRFRTAPVSRPKPVSIDHSKMKELERNPGATGALKQVSTRALKKHKSLAGVPGLMPASGPDSAKVKVFIFSDFQCPVCRRVVEPVKLVARAHPKDVQIVFVQNALVMHPNAERAALAALAATRQNRFWEFHDRLFQDQSKLSDSDLLSHAQAIGLNITRFKKDMAAAATLAQVQYERNLSTALGVRGTPGFFINGRKMVGWGSYSGFNSLVKRALKKAEGVSAKGRGGAAAAATKSTGDDGKKFAELVWGLR